jgi:uncharacterized protein YbaA (DUF1428 family)
MMISFPEFAGKRCLMMPYVQGYPETVPNEYRRGYDDVLATLFVEHGALGFLTIDESAVAAGSPHRGARAKHGRALHTEAGLRRGIYCWGQPQPGWGGRTNVTLERSVRVLISSNIANSCAVWDAEHVDTSEDGDIGHEGDRYPYATARMLAAGEVADIGIFTPHESLPVQDACNRQFLRIVSRGVHGREEYFTRNRLLTDEQADEREGR